MLRSYYVVAVPDTRQNGAHLNGTEIANLSVQIACKSARRLTTLHKMSTSQLWSPNRRFASLQWHPSIFTRSFMHLWESWYGTCWQFYASVSSGHGCGCKSRLWSDVDKNIRLSLADFVNRNDTHLGIVTVQPWIYAQLTPTKWYQVRQISPCTTLQGAATWQINRNDPRATAHLFGIFHNDSGNHLTQ